MRPILKLHLRSRHLTLLSNTLSELWSECLFSSERMIESLFVKSERFLHCIERCTPSPYPSLCTNLSKSMENRCGAKRKGMFIFGFSHLVFIFNDFDIDPTSDRLAFKSHTTTFDIKTHNGIHFRVCVDCSPFKYIESGGGYQ